MIPCTERLRNAIVVAALVLCSPAVAQDESPPTKTNLDRILRMSPAMRGTLLENLDKFESLPDRERSAIRELDARVAEASPETRDRYLALLRRYHAFRKNLPEADRKALDEETDPARKLALIAKSRDEQKARLLANPMPYENAFQISELSRVRLRATARELVVWFSLDPKEDAKERNEFGRMKDPAARRAFARELARKKELGDRMREEEDEFREAEAAVRKTLPRLLTEQIKAEAQKRMQNRANGGAPAAKEGESGENLRRMAVTKLDEIQVFKNLDNDPVNTKDLERFEMALPSWARETLDPLPPDAAKRRLRVLYRLVYPTGTEMPAPKAARGKAVTPSQ